MEKIRINVTLPEATPERLESLRSSLSAQGVEVESVLDTIGIITGKVEKSQLSSLDPGEGATVEPDESIQLPPPGEPLQ